MWEWKTGALITQIPIMESVQPFLLMNGGRKSWKRLEHKKRKGREGGSFVALSASIVIPAPSLKKPEVAAVDSQDKEGLDNPASSHEAPAASFDEDGDYTLVISKIEAFQRGTQDLILFSAVGLVNPKLTRKYIFWHVANNVLCCTRSSALFYIEYPFMSDATKPAIRHIDFGQPILDFTSRLASGEVWVSLDASWKAETTEIAPDSVSASDMGSFKCVRWEDKRVWFLFHLLELFHLISGPILVYRDRNRGHRGAKDVNNARSTEDLQ
jgi:hypothetical protein